MIQRTTKLIVCVMLAGAGVITSQVSEYRTVENPFQDDFEFTVNSDLQPMVEISGVRWSRFGVHVRGDRDIEPEKDMPITVELGFVNTNPEGVKVLVIALFEDTYGNPLDRIECAQVNAATNRLKESTQKFKVSGRTLESMQRVYLYCEIER